MNFDLAMMALEGLAKSPLQIVVSGSTIVVEAQPAAFRELARLCLILGGEGVAAGEEIELRPQIHVAEGSPTLLLRLPT